MKKKLFIFTLTLALWFVFAGRANIHVFLLGTIICSLISIILPDHVFRLVKMKYGTKDIFFKIYYLLLVTSSFVYDVFSSAFRVSKHAFKKKSSFSPRTVKIQTSLENTNSFAIYANFITLTQGTLAMNYDILNKEYFIHWLDVHSDNEAEVKIALIRKHENLIAKIFE